MTESSYWETFYRQSKIPLIPSQFAAFTLSEINGCVDGATGRGGVIEFGCGNGRDSLFFARHGCDVVGFDQSASAIQHCNQIALDGGIPARFFAKNVVDIDYEQDIQPYLEDDVTYQIYSRFFLHAITEGEEEVFLRLVKDILARHKGFLFMEFRTEKDQTLQKESAAHFRRFIKPVEFIERALAQGLAVKYSVEGFGFAKYRQDDAHVARMILTQP